jgi:opacity protein-like surface antigen
MKYRILSLVAILALTFCGLLPAAHAQQGDQPAIDVFGGYSRSSNFDTGLNGWLLSGNLGFSRNFGLEGDFSGHYGKHGLGGLSLLIPNLPTNINSNMYNVDFGPRFTYRFENHPVNAFGHVLFGVSRAHLHAPGVAEDSDSSFSWVLGVGGDYNIRDNWAARVQVDYLHTDFASNGEGHPRISLGVVYRLGPAH